MIEPVITLIVPPPAGSLSPAPGPTGPEPVLRRAALPLPGLSPAFATAEGDARPRRVYGLSAVDDRGRLADRVVWPALGWTPGTRLQIRTVGDLVVVQAEPGGAFAVTRQRHVRISATIRRW